MDTELLAALPPLSLPLRAAVDEAAAAAGSMFWEAMVASMLETDKTEGRAGGWSEPGHSWSKIATKRYKGSG